MVFFIVRALFNYGYPSVGVRCGAILNGAQEVIKLFGYRSGLAVLGDDIALMVLQIVDFADWTDYSCCAASSRLLESAELFLRNGAYFHFQTEILGQLLQTSVGNGRKNGS